jgi:4-hydroxybenzoate polyprenyltransferase
MVQAGTVPSEEVGFAMASTICVDLDGTLIATDLLWESLLELVKQHPFKLLLIPFWLLSGRAVLKEKMAQSVSIDASRLPYREDVVKEIRERREQGARVVLATASHEALARGVAAHLNCFDEVLATSGAKNLKGKAEALRARYGDDFLYIGDSVADLPVWAIARQGIVVGSTELARRAAKVTHVREVFRVHPAGWRAYWQALRPHHWSKNVLLLVPLLLAHRFSADAWARTVLGMLFFGLGASAIYVTNDLLDLPSDRQHPWKRFRPLASGRLSITKGLLLAPVVLLCGIGAGGYVLGWRFGVALAVYCALALAYSLVLKRKVLADIFVLTSFYGIRIITGALITRTALSNWFLIFSMFFFFSLALAKRYSELIHAEALVKSGNSGRGYRAVDSPLLSIMGVSSAFAAIMVFGVYTRSPEVSALYPHPAGLLMIAPLLLYWLMRIWLQAERGELQEDPVTLAMRDPMSYLVGLGCVICVLITFFWR